MLETIHYIAGALVAFLTIMGLEVGLYKILLETRTVASRADERTKEMGDRLEDVEQDINGLAVSIIRHTDANVPVTRADGGQPIDDDCREEG